MNEIMEDRFVLKDHEQVETAYLAALVSEGAEELEEELAFHLSLIPAADMRFVATGETAHLYREQAVVSLAEVCTQGRDKYPHLVTAARGLLLALRGNEAK